mgnify:CR=1 FL=1
MCGICATPPNKDIHKTALGATDSVEWEYVDDTLALILQLKSEGTAVVSIEQAEESVSLEGFKTKSDTTYAIIFGNEVKGVSQEVVSASDYIVEIPQYGTKHSLNISVSCGLVIWDLFVKLKM